MGFLLFLPFSLSTKLGRDVTAKIAYWFLRFVREHAEMPWHKLTTLERAI
jgi:hypothetical protein